MKIKKDDQVKVTAGKDKGKTGKVSQVFPKWQRVVVEGVNKKFKHLRPRREGEKGQRIEFDAPLEVSNVQLVCPKCNKITRIGYKMVGEKKKKERICTKCKEII